MNNIATENVQVRDSVRTERERLTADISTLQKRLTAVQQRSERGFDPAYSRTASTIKRQITAARDRVEAFDEKQRLLSEARTGVDAKAAQKEAQKAARDFEEKLAAFAAAASMLKIKAAVLADALQIRDPGLWPSTQAVAATASCRIIDAIGLAGFPLEGFGTSGGKASQPLTNRFSMETK